MIVLLNIPFLFPLSRLLIIFQIPVQFSVPLSCKMNFYFSSFLPQTSALWNPLPSFCFADKSNLNSFKIINRGFYCFYGFEGSFTFVFVLYLSFCFLTSNILSGCWLEACFIAGCFLHCSKRLSVKKSFQKI